MYKSILLPVDLGQGLYLRPSQRQWGVHCPVHGQGELVEVNFGEAPVRQAAQVLDGRDLGLLVNLKEPFFEQHSFYEQKGHPPTGPIGDRLPKERHGPEQGGVPAHGYQRFPVGASKQWGLLSLSVSIKSANLMSVVTRS